jgi:hypothetical protein
VLVRLCWCGCADAAVLVRLCCADAAVLVRLCCADAAVLVRLLRLTVLLRLCSSRPVVDPPFEQLEGKVLRQLRPQLEEVMRQEIEIKQLSSALLQTQWEARTFASKEQQLQTQLETLRQEHAQRMYASAPVELLARAAAESCRC